ncbi:arsenic resistance N-acetyltransferase ArsN2 [Azospirillum rugosum]|uniref:N-acetylglutamate synthase-like GNAT family acetyltransferase n=1 Tax=Azospirillum rugosum TaxID=416170 RepID=A0ABS4SSG0_9PROT|nr:arsenic resistance N-acetyltransferase ArsN2 [Azospirillum rugosum]MBP2295501.1 N-acetylglutamate synthase-like GNAT family acetyltransferase [Azospirillum rugosum]MDQ0528380.1 N-acetylglutamate synthase-like GNAT family acetyltransferase [Azospirillum rugosum]
MEQKAVLSAPSVTPPTAEDMPLLAELLAADGLPTGDLTAPGRHFWRVEDGDGLLGYGGLEAYGADGLLRSVVVPVERRGGGAGRAVVAAVSEEARRLGVERLWLLTIGVAGFFERLGFQRADRKSAPADIAASAQFAGLCPGSAVCLRRDLIPPATATSGHPAGRE